MEDRIRIIKITSYPIRTAVTKTISKDVGTWPDLINAMFFDMVPLLDPRNHKQIGNMYIVLDDEGMYTQTHPSGLSHYDTPIKGDVFLVNVDPNSRESYSINNEDIKAFKQIQKEMSFNLDNGTLFDISVKNLKNFPDVSNTR